MAGLLSIERRGDVALRDPAAPGEAQRALDRAARGARRRIRRALRRRRRGMRRAHRRGLRLLLGDGHGPVRRRPRAQAAAGRDEHPRLRGGRQAAVVRWSPPSTARRSRAASRWRCSATCESPRASATFGYPELPRGIPPSYAAARAVLPATVAQELCLTGRIVHAGRGAEARHRPRGGARGRRRRERSSSRQRVAALPRDAVLETKRRTLLERRHLWGFLFDDEKRVFTRALLGEESAAEDEPGAPA